MNKDIFVLGIETSCDETAASVVKNGTEIISNVVASQIESHKRFGGVVPEIASRHHVEQITIVIEEALQQANLVPTELSAVAVTEGPGLVGALLVGVNAAKAFAFAHSLPLVGVHHIAGHIYANRLEQEMEFPLLSLVISGGHTELILMKEHGDFTVIGETRDDAAGEAYDKVARTLNLPYPGGPHIDRLAHQSVEAVDFPRVWLEEGSYDFSFSGLKSSVLNYMHNMKQRGETPVPEAVAAGFQNSVVEVVTAKTLRAAREFAVQQVIAAGGVAANKGLRKSLTETFEKESIPFFIPPLPLCTDNAAMIAAAGTVMYEKGLTGDMAMNGRPGMPLSSWI
ncbi:MULTISPECIES: tRNA (adenosine(37)-N6)-threonylcarbamoyltransferase complex transferase subunit TsaD [unclassified Planococcus (in: firmicutes)]|uniref:tRNA (adenosine(37)-N6)-threonylcarbamoyltransferase complex transferase subunit TsaD n=1 Tax=unclassified Planococcus (in: firmicutes) TaxID=2662419 RepID=UPI000C342BD0|nr:MULTISPECIES: tRNA (adenosine(37)-N6)-threonylcarbamoyltransferase complex transferase subunit TsaD [unclassified Planococcus (in: firmicutes)]AUD12993.1 tRNA (adenosine(37)-N6)-threonylcarbamoyltransferase complex transferase subunit TsaD [Planococcus sp. MB-3u-03]PKG45528.1 tRNA (adenosine(37)-N6)-threonylcarbamoyltransferase complex transferase subunit TsaD [Planococcus sp. Urea-trap-24]PKG88875.1 tRNA (adenosine(37)-N6)-threonylcarbamoyltransferase complex transferase subunit TsaD [Planoc